MVLKMTSLNNAVSKAFCKFNVSFFLLANKNSTTFALAMLSPFLGETFPVAVTTILVLISEIGNSNWAYSSSI